ncbi:hypothetical protein, partial [Cyanobium sp. FACHB-13342]|uniref:DUF5801 repeats-in-toxin domain-containing protein n=1 Tax=Cyanobium sp. FACHB-13342 TaxID=2692793 RepID=UPI0016807367
MDSAQFTSFDADPSLAERDNSATGNITDAPVYTGPGSGDNPDGNTPTGEGVDNTGTEQALDSTPPANNVTQDIPGPDVPEGGGSGGGLGGTTTTNEAPQEPTVEQNGVPQSDPDLATGTPLAAAEAPNNPPTVAVLPGTPDVPPEAGEVGPDDDDDIYNDRLRADDPELTLPPGAVAELGLEDGFDTLAVTRGTIVVNDPDGINDIATVTIAGVTYTIADLNAIDPANPRYQIPLEVGDGDDISEGTLVLESFNPATGEIFFRFELTSPVDNEFDSPNIDQNSALIPFSVTVVDQAGASATADGGIRIVDATPEVVTSALAGAPDPFVTGDDDLGTPIVNNFADNFAASFNPGSDGESARSTSYALSLGEGSTGLFDLDGNEIVLIQNPETGLITGIANGVPMFTVSVDSLGNVSLTQLQPMQHFERNEAGEIVGTTDSLSLPANLIWLTRTDTLSDTDGDTDVSSATIEISSGFTFLDSEPTLTVNDDMTFDPLSVVEASGAVGKSEASITAPSYTATAVDGQTTTIDYS